MRGSSGVSGAPTACLSCRFPTPFPLESLPLDEETGWTGWGNLDRETLDRYGKDRLTILEDLALAIGQAALPPIG